MGLREFNPNKLLDPDNLYWRCYICNMNRRDACISVHKIDLSEEFNQPPMSSTRNIKYCNDNIDCIEKAKRMTAKDD